MYIKSLERRGWRLFGATSPMSVRPAVTPTPFDDAKSEQLQNVLSEWTKYRLGINSLLRHLSLDVKYERAAKERLAPKP